MTTGFPMGSEVSGPQGKADFSFSVEGSKSRETVYLDALWTGEINRLELEIEGRRDRIDLNQ